MAAFLGQLRIDQLRWGGGRTLIARFTSGHVGRYHQLYAGRRRIGLTSGTGQRVIAGQLGFARYPEQITLLAVDPADRARDFGDDLPLRPYNRVRLGWTASGFPSDAEFFDITAGIIPGGAVDSTNRIGRVLFAGDRDYSFLTRPQAGTGQWNFEITARDNRKPDGNAGTAVAASQTVLAHPPDVPFDSAGDRLSVAIAGAELTVTATVPAD